MISPKKHNHPDKTLVYTSYLMLDKLRKERILNYDVLLKYVKKNVTSGEFLFMPSLNFLYLLGLIEYKTRTDSIEYIEKKYVIEPIQYLDKIVTNIIEHKFMNINDKIINQNSEYKNLVTNISKIFKKVVDARVTTRLIYPLRDGPVAQLVRASG